MTTDAVEAPPEGRDGPAAILAEALATIEETYWVQGDEFKFVESFDLASEVHVKVVPADVTASFRWRANADGDVGVVQVCSIGAIALARSTLYRASLDVYDRVAKLDPHVKAAGVALADTIMRLDLEVLDGLTGEESVITDFNDDYATTRDTVLDRFHRALESPLLAAKQAWQLVSYMEHDGRPYLDNSISLWFASEADALEFREQVREVLRTYAWHGPAGTVDVDPAVVVARSIVVSTLPDENVQALDRYAAEKVCEW